MKLKSLTLLLLAGLTTCGWVLAQSTSEESSNEPNSELKNYQSWSVQCQRDDQGEKSCIQYQRVNLENGQRLMVFTVQKGIEMTDSDEPANIALITVPLGVHLPSGATMQIDEDDAISMTYERCDQNGCYTGLVIDDDLLRSLQSGSETKISINDLSGQTITANLSLRGFTAGFNSF